MMTAQFTCSECGSSIEVYPDSSASQVNCEVCSHNQEVKFDANHMSNILKDCACCGRKDFFIQKDFNRKIGVALFVIAAILSIWTYGISLIVLYLMDLILFRKLKFAAVCYKCNTIYRGITNMNSIAPFDHEMHDRIVYSDHDFKGIPHTH